MCAKTKKEAIGTKTSRKRSAKIISQKFIDLMEKPRKKKGKLTAERLNLINSAEFQEKVQKKAFELFEQRGFSHGNDWNDWFEAEEIVKKELSN